MALLSDFGGFNDGVLIIPGTFMGIYAAICYQAELLRLTPINIKPGKMKNINLKRPLSSVLDSDEISEITNEVGKNSLVRTACL